MCGAKKAWSCPKLHQSGMLQRDSSTQRPQRSHIQRDVRPLVVDMLNNMCSGGESHHLNFLRLLGWCRVSWLREACRLFDTQRSHDCGSQCSAAKWTRDQQINVLELRTLLNHMRLRAVSGSLCACRQFRLFDPLDMTSVCSKGMPSSLVLNRLSRRLMSISLEMCAQTLALWFFPVEFQRRCQPSGGVSNSAHWHQR